MATQNTFGSDRAGARPSPSLAHESGLPADARRARRQRVDEYEAQGLQQPGPFESFLSAVQADVIRAAYDLGDAAEQALAGRTTVEGKWDAEQKLNDYLRIIRRIGRNALLEIRTY